jgi:CPA2 family monovalent cation:H+ antiporter-2
MVIATLAVILLGKPAAALGLVLGMRYPLRVAVAVAVALAQIGEFSFILATLGRQLGILPDNASNLLVAAAIISITLNPLLYRWVDPLEAWLRRRSLMSRFLQHRAPDEATAPVFTPHRGRYRAVVVGYGPVGHTVARLMRENDIEPAVVELNLETVQRLRGEGILAVYGDASHLETLKEAGVADARFLILSASSIRAGQEVIRAARQLNPHLEVLARTAYLREETDLRAAGADAVFAGEGEVALSMTEHIMRELGATEEQIDRESERIREEVWSTTPGVRPPAQTAGAPKAP